MDNLKLLLKKNIVDGLFIIKKFLSKSHRACSAVKSVWEKTRKAKISLNLGINKPWFNRFFALNKIIKQAFNMNPKLEQYNKFKLRTDSRYSIGLSPFDSLLVIVTDVLLDCFFQVI